MSTKVPTESSPRFVASLKSQQVSENVDVEFSCTISGNPEPKITWYRGDKELPKSLGLPKYEILKNGAIHTLKLYRCSEDDATIYQASARSKKGIAVCSAVLRVGSITEVQIRQSMMERLRLRHEAKRTTPISIGSGSGCGCVSVSDGERIGEVVLSACSSPQAEINSKAHSPAVNRFTNRDEETGQLRAALEAVNPAPPEAAESLGSDPSPKLVVTDQGLSLAASLGKHLGALVESESQSQHSKNQPISEIAMQPCSLYPDPSKQMGRWVGVGVCGSTILEEEDILDELVCSDVLNEIDQAAWTKALSCQDPLSDALKWTSTLDNKLVRWTQPEEVTLTSPLLIQARSTTPQGGVKTPPYPSGEHLLSGPVDPLSGLVDPQPVTPTQHQHTQLQVQGTQLGQYGRTSPILPPEGPHLGQAGARVNLGVAVAEVGQLVECRESEVSREELTFKETCVPICDDSNSIEVQENQPQETTIAALKGSVTPPGSEHRGTWERSTARPMVGDTEDKPADITVQVCPIATVERNQQDHLASLQVERTRKEEGNMEGFFGAEKYCQIDMAKMQPLLLEAGERPLPENNVSSTNTIDDHSNCRTCDDRQTPDPNAIPLSQQEGYSCESDSTRFKIKCEMLTDVLFTKSMTLESSGFKEKGIDLKSDQLLLLSLSGERDELDPALDLTESRMFSPVTLPTNLLNTLHDRTVQTVDGLEEKVCEEHKDTQALVQCMGSNAGTASIGSSNISETLISRESTLNPVWHLNKGQSVAEHKLAEPVLLSISGERESLDLSLDVMENSPVTESKLAATQPMVSLLITITDREVMAREEASLSERIDWYVGENETKRVNQENTSTNECQGPCTVQDVRNGDHPIVCAINEQVGEQTAYPTEISTSPVKDGEFVGGKGEFHQSISTSICKGDDLTCISGQHQGSEMDCGMETKQRSDLLMPIITGGCDLQMESLTDDISICDIDTEPFRPRTQLCLQRVDPSSFHHKESNSNELKAEDQYGKVDLLQDSQTPVAMSVHISNTAHICSTISLTNNQCLDEELKYSLDVYSENAVGLKKSEANLEFTKSSQVESSPTVAHGPEIVPIMSLSHSNVDVIEGFSPKPVPQISPVHKAISSELEKSSYGLENKVHQEYFPKNILLNATAGEHDQTVQLLEVLEEKVSEEYKDTQASVQYMGSNAGRANVASLNSSEALTFPTPLVPPVWHLDKQESVAEHKLVEPLLVSVCGERQELELALCVMETRTFGPAIEATVVAAQPVDSILLVNCEVMAREKVSDSKMIDWNATENETERVNQQDTSTTECQGYCTAQDIINVDNHVCAINKQLRKQSAYPTVVSMSPVMCAPFANDKPDIQSVIEQVWNSEPVLELEDNLPILQYLGEPDITVDTSRSAPTKMGKSDGSLLATGQLQPVLVSNTSDDAMRIMEFNEIIVENEQESSTTCFAIIETSIHPQMMPNCALERATKVVWEENHERVQLVHNVLPTNPETLESLFIKVPSRDKVDIIQPVLQDQVHSVLPITELLGPTELNVAGNCKCSEEFSLSIDQSALLQREAGQLTKDSETTVTPSVEDSHKSDQSQGEIEKSANASASLRLGMPSVSEWLKGLTVRSAASDENNSLQTLEYRGNWKTGSGEHSELNAGQMPTQLGTKTEPGNSCIGNKPVSITRENTETKKDKNHDLPTAPKIPESHTVTQAVVNFVIMANPIEPEIQMEFGKGEDLSAPAALSCFPPDVKARTSRENTGSCCSVAPVCQTPEAPNNKVPKFPALLNVKNDTKRRKDNTEQQCSQKASKVSVQDGQGRAVGMVSSMPSKPLAKERYALELCISELAGATELTADVKCKHLEEPSSHIYQSALFQGEAGQLSKNSGTNVALSAVDGHTSDQTQDGTQDSAIISISSRLDTPSVSEWLKSLIMRSAALGVNNSSQTPGSRSNCKSGAVENSALNAGQVISQLQTKTVAEKSCGGTKPMSITGDNTENKEGKNHHLPTTPKSPDSDSVVQPVVPSITISDTKEPEIQMELDKMFPGGDLINSSAPTPLPCFPSDSKVTNTDAECKETVREIPKPPDNQTHRFPAWLNVENDSQRDKNNNGLPGAQTVSKVSAKDGLGRDVGSVSSTPSKTLAKASIAFEPCITEVIGATELTTAQNCKHSGESSPHVDQSASIQGKASQFTKDSETNVVLSAEDGHISIQSQGGTEEVANVSTDLSLDATSVSEWLKSLMVRSAASRVDNISQALGHQGDCKMVAEEHSVLNADEVAGQLWPKVEPGKNSWGNKRVSVTEEKAQANESKNHDLPMPLQSPESVTIAHPVVHSLTNVYSIEPDIQPELGKGFPRGDVNKSCAPAALHCFPSVNQVTNIDAECNETVCKTQKHPNNMTPKFPARLNVENTSQRDKADIMLLCGLKESNVRVKPGQRKVDGSIPSMPSKLLSKDSAAFAPCITKILGASELIPAVNCKHLKESSPCLDQSSLFDAEASQIIEDSSISVALSAEDGHTSVQSQGVSEEQANVSTGPTLDAPPGSEQLKSLMVRSAAKGVDDSSQTLGYQGDCDTVAGEHSLLNAGQVAGRLQPKTEPGKGCRGNKSASVTRENTESIQGKNLSTALNSPEFATITHTVLNSVTNADTIKAEIRMELGKGFPGGNLNRSSAPDALSCFPPDIKARTSKQNTDAEHTKMVCQILEPPNNKTPNFPAQLNVKNDSQIKKDYAELPGAQKVSKVSVQDKQRKAVEMVSSMPSKSLARNSVAFELCITELAGAAELSAGVNSKHLEESSTHVNQPALFEGDVGQLTKGSGTSVAISAEDGPTSDQSQGGTEESAIVSVGLTLDTPPVSELLQGLMVRSAALGVNNSSHIPGRQGDRKSLAVENSAMNTSQVGSKLQTKTMPGKSCGATKPVAITGNNTENNKGKNHHLPTTPKSPDSDPVAQPVVPAITIPDTKEPEIQKELGKVFPGGDLKSSAPTPLHCFPSDSKVANTGTDCKEMVHKIPKPPDKQTHKFPAWLNMENDSQREKESNELLGVQTVSKVSINKGLRRIVGSISSTPAKPLAKASVTFVPCITEVLGATELTTAVNCKHSEAPSPHVDQSALFQGQTSQFTKDSGTNVTLSAEDGHISVQSQGGTVKSANVSTGLILDVPLVSERLKSLIVRSTALGINNSSQVLSHGGDCKMMAEEHATLNEGQVAGQLRPKTEPGKSPRRNTPASITGENIQANEGKNLDLPTTPESPESDTVAHPVVHSLTKFDTIEPEIQMEIGKKFPGADINKSRASASLPCFPPDFKGSASKQTKDTEPTKTVCQLLKPPSNKIPKFPTRLNVKNDSWEYEIDKDSNELLGAQKASKVSVKKGQKRVLGLVSSTPSKPLAKGSATIVPCTTEIVGATELTAVINSKQSEDPSPCVDQSVLFPGEAGQLFKNSRHPVSSALSPEYSRTSEQSQGGTKESAKFSAGLRVGAAPVNERLKSLKARLAALGVDNSSQTIQSRGNCRIVAREHSVLNAGQVIGRLRLKTEPGRTCKGNKSTSVTGENTETNEGKNRDPPTALKSPESGKSAHLVVNSVTNANTIEPEVPMQLGKGFPGGGHNKSSAPAGLYCFPPDVKAIKKDAECKKMVSQIPMPSGNKISKFPAQLNLENNSWEYESDKDIIKLPRAQKVSKVSMQDGQRSVVGSASSMPSKPLAQGSDDFVPFDCMTIPKVKIPLAGATTKELMLGARKKVNPPKAPSEIPSAAPEPVDLITKVDDQPKKEAVKRSLLSPVRQETVLSETCSSAEKENLIEDTTGTKRICQKIGEEAAQHSDYQELRALQPQKEVQKGEEEIELLQFTVEKELTTQCNFGGQVWGRIATEEVHFGEGLHRKAFRTKVICGLLPLFDPGHTCVLKIHNHIAYGTNSNNEIIELNYKLAVQECQVQNTARQYACKFAAEGMLLDAFGEGPEVIPIYLIHRAANTIPYATVEEELIGDFVKYSVKDGRELNVGRKMSEAGQKCCTFQHWVYQRTDGNLLVTDMQGVGMKLTDIGIATCSKGYKGFKGNCYISFIEQFKALHQCNEYCNMMGLKSLKTSPQKSRRTGSVKTHLTYNQSLTQHRKYR